ncbi:MAG: VOC family protein [Acidimicrobiales bacterium]
MWWGCAIEAPDPVALARFYSDLLEWPEISQEPGTAILAAPEGSIYLVFQQSDSYRTPVWPPSDEDQRPMMHLDFRPRGDATPFLVVRQINSGSG